MSACGYGRNGRPVLSGCLAAIWLVLALAGLGLLAGCAAPGPVRLIPAAYRDWPALAEPVNYAIPGHGTNQRRMFIDPRGAAALGGAAAGEVRFPDGTVIVKEVYGSSQPAPGEDPQMLTAMVKAPQDPRAKGGWLWVMRPYASGDETVLASEFCLTCHANANEAHPYGDKNPQGAFRDYVFFAAKAP